MLFNSLNFLAFFAAVYLIYLVLLQKRRLQNTWLLAASYFFYGSWDARFLSLILASTVIDYCVGRALDSTQSSGRRKALLTVSIVANLSILGFFKYFNFFAESTAQVLMSLGMEADYATLNIILPVGISFYTFQTLSYTIDIYRRKITHTNSFLDFALFVAFFPQLVAGPIERAARLLPQIQRRRRIVLAEVEAGLFLICWGYFKKVVVADNVGILADRVFGAHAEMAGLDLLIGAIAFAIQIYCDFSGYSDIARGICKLLGFDLMINFRQPFFALNPSDFWRRWHISLSTWLRDYLYISLGGNRAGQLKTLRNLMLTMILGGLWHGAAWNFVLWGCYHGLLLCAYRVFDRSGGEGDTVAGPIGISRMLAKMALMSCFTLVGWVIFRSQSVEQAFYFLTNLNVTTSATTNEMAYALVFFSAPLITMEVFQYLRNDLLAFTKQRAVVQGGLYGLMLAGITVFGARDSLEFIYFQF